MFMKRWNELGEKVASCIAHLSGEEIHHDAAITAFQRELAKVRNACGIVYVVGNGGSAGIASHFSIDCSNTLRVPSQTLYDSNVMTCIANDYGYEQVFSRQLERLLHKEDCLVAISSSGA